MTSTIGRHGQCGSMTTKLSNWQWTTSSAIIKHVTDIFQYYLQQKCLAKFHRELNLKNQTLILIKGCHYGRRESQQRLVYRAKRNSWNPRRGHALTCALGATCTVVRGIDYNAEDEWISTGSPSCSIILPGQAVIHLDSFYVYSLR